LRRTWRKKRKGSKLLTLLFPPQRGKGEKKSNPCEYFRGARGKGKKKKRKKSPRKISSPPLIFLDRRGREGHRSLLPQERKRIPDHG